MNFGAARLLVQAGVPQPCVELFGSPRAWRRVRETRPMIGASDIAKIRGIAPQGWGTEWEVWERITKQRAGEQLEPRQETEAQARGHALEETAVKLYQNEHGGYVNACGELPVIVRHPDWDRCSCSPDAIHRPDNASPRGLEVKTSLDREAWGEPCTIPSPLPSGYLWPCPPYYATQVYELQALCRMPFDLVLLDAFYQLKVWRFQRDPLTEAEIFHHARRWWERHIEQGHQPEVDGSPACGRWVARVPKEGTQPPRHATDEERRLLIDYAHAQAQLRALQRVVPALEHRILDLAGPVEGLQLGRTTVKINRRRRGGARFGALELLAQLPKETP